MRSRTQYLMTEMTKFFTRRSRTQYFVGTNSPGELVPKYWWVQFLPIFGVLFLLGKTSPEVMRNAFIHICSCEIVALQENFVDRPESYDLVYAKSCIFLAHEKTRTVWGILFHSHTQSDPKQGIKKFLRHFPTTLVPSLTLQISDIVHSSLQSPTLKFCAYDLPYSRSWCLVTWQREVKLCKVSDGTRV
jgi:hypothetical protein